LSAPFEALAGLDRLVHEPARLALLSALACCERADFLLLLSLTGLSKGNLSSHLAKLEQAGLVSIEKRFLGKMPNTQVSLTDAGRAAIRRHWEALERLRRDARSFQPPARAKGG
jgi:DNA-binding MarR family transcriptional regulator